MPYIKESQRKVFRPLLSDLPYMRNKGELEYCIFFLMQRYMDEKPRKYTHLHDVVYAAQHCADEFRRRFLDEREDQAREENGDVD